MGLWTKLDRSAGLAGGMAERLGVDLAGEMLSDPESAAGQYRALVLRCATCRCQDECTGLQASHETLDAAPDYCVNKTELERRAAAS